MNKLHFFAAFAAITLVACGAPAADDTENAASSSSAPIVIEFPSNEASSASSAGHMMMATAALKEPCDVLTAKTAGEKAAILDEIAHNMDLDALDMLLGTKCAFLGETQKVADLTDPALKLMPNDADVLYFNPMTGRYFATCLSANTVAYVVEKKTADADAKAYFEANRQSFVDAATMAKSMMDMMGDHGMAEGDSMMPEDDMMKSDAGHEGMGGHYAAYAEGAIGNGSESVLFFHANWCPNCRQNDAMLTAWYDTGSVSRSTHKINYDAAGQLRQAYNVTQQDTFILVDGQGKEIKRLSFPTEEQLKEIVGAA